MPEDLVDSIVSALEGDAPAPAPEPLDEGPVPTAEAAALAPAMPQKGSGDINETVRRIIAETDPELLRALKQALDAA